MPVDASIHPPCMICGGEVIRRDEEAMKRFRRRKTCSQACYLQFQRTHAPPRSHHGENGPGLLSHVHWAVELQNVDYGGGFGRNNITEKPSYGRLPPRPITHPVSLVGTSTSMAVRSRHGV